MGMKRRMRRVMSWRMRRHVVVAIHWWIRWMIPRHTRMDRLMLLLLLLITPGMTIYGRWIIIIC